MAKIKYEDYLKFKDQPILHDEDMWNGKYRTFGEMWEGEGVGIDFPQADKPKISPAMQRALKNYKAKVSRFTVDFPPRDADLYEHLQKQPNKQGYIKALIRADMEGGSGNG